jgi:death-on-curing protein
MRWHWIRREALLHLHGMSLVQFGGLSGLRDEGLFESAMVRPEQRAHYGNPDVADLSAAYAYGLAKNHPFIDGNKRVAFLALGLSLRLNGYRLTANQSEATQMVMSLAGGHLTEDELAKWIRMHSSPVADYGSV